MRLIDVNEAKRQLQNSKIDDPTSGSAGWRMAHNVILDILNNLPAVDAAPVVHGRWIAVPSSDMMTGKAYKCSECNKMRYGSFMPNYCQICGAKMDGKDDEC